MSNWKWLLLTCGTILVVAGVWTSPTAQSVAGPGVIQGNITSAAGTPMEGVIVSARASDDSFTTSVFTDRQGRYVFPSLAAGQYRVWAQAVGFEAGRSEFAMADARVDRSFTLAPVANRPSLWRRMTCTDRCASAANGGRRKVASGPR